MICAIILLTKYISTERDFDEWFNHHIKLGFAHVYVYDNGVPFDLCAACVKYGLRVSYHKVDGHICQFDIYERHIKNSDVDYLMPIDDDEYLWINDEFKTIDKIIKHYGSPDSRSTLAVSAIYQCSSIVQNRIQMLPSFFVQVAIN